MKRYLTRGALVAIPFLIVIALVFPRAGAWLVVQDPLDKADAIFVLGGTMYERPLEAVDLFHEGWAPRIMLVRQMADNGERELAKRGIQYPREVDIQVEVLGRLGVPAASIRIIDPAADSTADEADFLKAIAAAEGLSRLIVVTSKQHTRRAQLVIRRRLAGTGVQVIMRYSRYDRADVDRWWRRRGTLRFTLFEYQRLLGYWTGLAD